LFWFKKIKAIKSQLPAVAYCKYFELLFNEKREPPFLIKKILVEELSCAREQSNRMNRYF
jgi:hypothetical protein